MQRVWIAIIIVLVFGAGFLIWQRSNDDSKRNFFASSEQGIQFKLDTSEEAQERVQEIEQVRVTDENTFVHQSPNFSFAIPEAHTVGEVPERGGKTVVVQNANTGLGFQLFVTPFDEDIVLTEARIRQDLPSITIQTPQRIPVGATEGLAFVSTNQTFGTSREVWFVYNGYLYQMSTYLNNETLLLKVLETFRIQS